MSRGSGSQKAVVVGAGILGVSTAVHLARAGTAVTLVTEGHPGDGASGRSLSWLNSSRMRSPEYHRLRELGIDRYRTVAAQQPEAPWLRFTGGLTWDETGPGNRIADAFAYERTIGYDAQLLSADQVAHVTPGVNTAAITTEGAIFNPGEGWVDLPSLIRELLAAFALLDGTLVTNAGQVSIETRDGKAVGAVTADGRRFEADVVLAATGANAPAMAADLGVIIADATPIALLVKTTPVHLPLRAVLNTPRVAVRPTPTGALVLDSAWSEKEVGIADDGSYVVRDSTVTRLLEEASAVLEGNPALELDSYGVGPKPIPGDGEPVFGELPGVDGCFVAFSHSGATLGLIAGELLAEEIVTGRPHPLFESFRPGRFTA